MVGNKIGGAVKSCRRRGNHGADLQNGTNIVRDAFSRIVFARLGSKCIYFYKYFSLPIELTRSFNERLQTESDVENEFDLPPVDEIPLEQAESVE